MYFIQLNLCKIIKYTITKFNLKIMFIIFEIFMILLDLNSFEFYLFGLKTYQCVDKIKQCMVWILKVLWNFSNELTTYWEIILIGLLV